MTTASLAVVARHLTFIRESDGPNMGAWVEWLQRFTGGRVGDPWCADFVSFVLDVAYHGKQGLPPSGSTQRLLDAAKTKGFVVFVPAVDDLYFFITETGKPHHVGIVTATDPLTGIAGNTSEDGLSSEGTGVFEHALHVAPSRIVFVRLPK
jgi:hypothetical protein